MECKNDPKKFRQWCSGKTGFPIVDAGMRQLNMTGFMHNRVRLIVASFLTKDLHIDWRLGERYFAEKLVDYDPCVNNGNWQWAASTGCDAQPYFRIFNPWLQQKKFDPQCKYIKKFVRELMNTPPELIHELYNDNRPLEQELNYPSPIVSHKYESRIALHLYAFDK
jgi:deoxyribodipyrimidine photo-lyase